MKVTGSTLHPILWDMTVFIRTKGMANTFNRGPANHSTQMWEEPKAPCGLTSHSGDANMLFLGQNLEHKRFWSDICREELNLFLQSCREGCGLFQESASFFMEEKKNLPRCWLVKWFREIGSTSGARALNAHESSATVRKLSLPAQNNSSWANYFSGCLLSHYT